MLCKSDCCQPTPLQRHLALEFFDPAFHDKDVKGNTEICDLR